MPIYMKYEGIVGEVAKKPYQGWVELGSAQLGTARASLPVSEIVITKVTDRTSTPFYKASLWGEGKNVTIDFVDADGTLYLRLELKGTLISGFYPTNSGSGAEQPIERLSLTFTKITSTPQAPLKDQKQAMHSMEFKRGQQRCGDVASFRPASPRARSAFSNHEFGREPYFPVRRQVAINQLQEQFGSPFTDFSSCLPYSCYRRVVSLREFDVVEARNRDIARNGNASCGEAPYQPHRHFVVAREDSVRKFGLR